MKPDPTRRAPALDPAAESEEPRYGDFLLVDLLRPDFRHFFSRYRTDLVGFVIISAIIAFIIFATKWLAMIGAGTGHTGAG
jgi:hypothetical protein